MTDLANNAPVDVPNYGELQIDIFNLISDWHHYAILSLGDIKPNRANPKWISAQLGITLRDASNAFDRLLRLGLIKKKNGFNAVRNSRVTGSLMLHFQILFFLIR